jgi:hypothetical protein
VFPVRPRRNELLARIRAQLSYSAWELEDGSCEGAVGVGVGASRVGPGRGGGRAGGVRESRADKGSRVTWEGWATEAGLAAPCSSTLLRLFSANEDFGNVIC